MSTIKVYAACLASYNQGILHGAWIEVPRDPSELLEEISKMLKASPVQGAEEWAFHDYEAPFHISEAQDIDKLCEWVEQIETADMPDDVVEAALGAYAGNVEDAIAALECYYGTFESWTDYAYDVVESLGYLSDVPEFVSRYFDYEAFGRDLAYDHMSTELNGKLYIFSY